MSKTSNKLKNSKTGKKQAVQKSAKKAAIKQYHKKLDEISTPAAFSVRTENFGKPLGDGMQIVTGAIGFFCLGFAAVYAYNLIAGFLAFQEESGYGLMDYINKCEPVLQCRIVDSSEILVALLMLIIGSVCIKMAFTNRYSKKKTIIAMIILAVITIIFLAISVIISKLTWG